MRTLRAASIAHESRSSSVAFGGIGDMHYAYYADRDSRNHSRTNLRSNRNGSTRTTVIAPASWWRGFISTLVSPGTIADGTNSATVSPRASQASPNARDAGCDGLSCHSGGSTPFGMVVVRRLSGTSI